MKGLNESSDLNVYRKFCQTAIRELLILKPKDEIKYYLGRANKAKTERELSRVMVDVRHAIGD